MSYNIFKEQERSAFEVMSSYSPKKFFFYFFFHLCIFDGICFQYSQVFVSFLFNGHLLLLLLLFLPVISGDLECPLFPHSESVTMMTIMDEVRRQLGVKYDVDDIEL